VTKRSERRRRVSALRRVGRFPRISQGEASYAVGSARDGQVPAAFLGGNCCNRTFGAKALAVGVLAAPGIEPSGKDRLNARKRTWWPLAQWVTAGNAETFLPRGRRVPVAKRVGEGRRPPVQWPPLAWTGRHAGLTPPSVLKGTNGALSGRGFPTNGRGDRRQCTRRAAQVKAPGAAGAARSSGRRSISACFPCRARENAGCRPGRQGGTRAVLS
jgi:hypothetical protein